MTSQLLTNGVFVLPGPAQIYGVVSPSVDGGIEEVSEHGDGSPYDALAAVMMQSPRFSLTTLAVSNALSSVGINGLAIGSAADLWYQRFQIGGTRMTGSNSTKATFALGMACLRSIDVEDRGLARLTMEVVAYSTDGTTSPIAFTASSSMPSPTLLDELFTVGPVKINGTEVGGIKSVSIDFGKQVVVETGDGLPYPTFVALQSVTPRIRFRTLHVNQAASPLGQFVAQGSTDSVIYLRKLSKNGTRVADGTAQHVSFSLDDGLLKFVGVTGSSREAALAEYEFVPTWDGTNDVVAIGRNVAIA